MIEEYKFGSIVINGKKYDYDVEVRWTGEVLKWRREESHFVGVEDVKRALGQCPEAIVVGTGETGLAEVSEEAKNFILEKGIRLVIDKTEEAARTFNIIARESKEEEGEQSKVIGLFHLTC